MNEWELLDVSEAVYRDAVRIANDLTVSGLSTDYLDLINVMKQQPDLSKFDIDLSTDENKPLDI